MSLNQIFHFKKHPSEQHFCRLVSIIQSYADDRIYFSQLIRLLNNIYHPIERSSQVTYRIDYCCSLIRCFEEETTGLFHAVRFQRY
jgi:hypothetical protein